MKLQVALTLTIRRDPKPQPPAPDAPQIDQTGSVLLERRPSFDTTGIGFQPGEIQ